MKKLALVFALLAAASTAEGQSFCNAAAITVTTGAANNAVPYPSPIVVTAAPTNITTVTVTLNGFSHTFPDDVGLVLVGPGGQALLLQDGAGDDPDMVSITYTLDSAAASVLPAATAWAAGSYKPTAHYSGDSFPAPGPLAVYGNPGPAGGGTATFASTFGGLNANGTWNLFVRDFATGDGGGFSGGWCIAFTGVPVELQSFSVE